MHPRPATIHLRLSPAQAELLQWELLGLLDHYRRPSLAVLEADDEAGLLDAVRQLETGLARARSVADVQLAQLRAAMQRSVEA